MMVASLASLVAAVAGCSSGDAPAALTPEAVDGRNIAVERGCTSCHGGDFAGGVGPSWVGLFGSEVALVSGETVIADRDYLVESIVDPNAERRLGTALQMPTVTLTNEEVELIVDYIVELGSS